MFAYLLLFLIALAGLLALAGRSRAVAVSAHMGLPLHSSPAYHGAYLALFVIGPAIFIMTLWSTFETRIISSFILDKYAGELDGSTLPQIQGFLRDAKVIASGGIASFSSDLKQAAARDIAVLVFNARIALLVLMAVCGLAGFFYAWRRIQPQHRVRQVVEQIAMWGLIACSAVALLTTIGIVFSLIFETIRFFGMVSLTDFLFGLHWSPQSAFEGAGGDALAEDNSTIFGVIPLFAGTFLITLIAMAVAAPVGLMSAIYLSDYASSRFRAIAKPTLEVLAGIPTVVYGFFAALTVAPAIRGFGEGIGLSVSSESAIATGLVMGIMIIPFVSSLSDDVINAIPQTLRDGSAALGATNSETIMRVVLPAALPGIVSALLLAISRAVGETMIVVMAAGLAANLTINPLQAVTTVTVQIVTLLVGDQEFDSAKTLAAFALGLVLFCITLVLNIAALRVVQKYRERYD